MTDNIRLLIFDWDGTLCDSLARIVSCLQLSAAELNLPVPSEAEGREIIGLGLPEALARLFPMASAVELAALKEVYAKNYLTLNHTPPAFYAGVTETLGWLKEQGYLLAVATGKSRRGLDRVLHAKGMATFFDATRCADETASKPHPLMIHELLAHFAVPPQQACMIGDTEFDMEMAVRARAERIGVAYGAHSAERLHSFGLRGCASLFADIVQWL